MVRRQRPVFLVVLFLVGLFLVASTSFAADATELYRAAKCNQCHAVDAREISVRTEDPKELGPDLGGTSRSADWIVDYVMHRIDKRGKKHQSSFKGKPADLRIIADWLRSI